MRPCVFILLVALSTLSSVSATVLEKIFTHNRGQDVQEVKKSGRFDETDEFEYIKRAIEEFKENIPKYTGFYFLDLLFEVVKNACIFFLGIVTPVDPPLALPVSASLTFDGSSSPSANNFGVVDNAV
ncbi:uncharacterized protein LOC110854406 isoform X2 [Folsomia candida]|uniref:Uncharacterized protein n=1 Tax=Folsomia candida TaxID=158441 RepID=A0A226DXY5_FOLCA|nr:uncharacterized protein LOC110854406 isoform X2 [Folsomia candida]OXA50089.1 hypothetical protein Fcan01_15149 [Folsomia candida]